MPDFIRELGVIRPSYCYGGLYSTVRPSMGEVIGGINIVGLPADASDNTMEQTLCSVLCSVHGDIVTIYTDPGYAVNKRVKEAVKKAAEDLRTDYKIMSKSTLAENWPGKELVP